MFVFLKILQEGVALALQELWSNKLRTFLSTLGIMIGIFCVISVQMLVDSVERSVKGSFSQLGENVVYIDRFPWNEDPSLNWWKYIKRPRPNYKEFKVLQERLQLADKVGIRIRVRNVEVKHKNNVISGTTIMPASHDFGDLLSVEMGMGRYFTNTESYLGGNVVIIGANVADELFPTISFPIGNTIRVMGKEVRVIGVIKREGASLLSEGFDNDIIVPFNLMRRYIDVNSGSLEPLIMVKAIDTVPLEQLKDEVVGVLRAHRKLKPKEKDNFALNQLSLLTNIIDGVFGVIGVAGWIIGLFAILVGGFGIANIMFVSVKERTGIIGIKKSLGAKSHFILFEFLIEAIVLCIAGGILGLLLVYGVAVLGNRFIDSFDLALTLRNIQWGIGISVVIGVISGFVPALNAAKMNPVEAIRQNF